MTEIILAPTAFGHALTEIESVLKAHGHASLLKRRDLREPFRKQKEEGEEKLALLLSRYWRKQAKHIRARLPFLGIPAKSARSDYLLLLMEGIVEGGKDAEELLAELTNLFRVAALEAVTKAAEGIKPALDPTLINAQAAAWARTQASAMMTAMTATTRKALGEVLAAFVETPGMTVGDVTKLMEPIFGEARAMSAAVTEITRVYAEGNQVVADTLKAEYPGVRVVKYWFTNNDDRVCFSAGTQIATLSGGIGIESIQAGDVVLTRSGPNRVIATFQKRYSGDWAEIHTPIGKVKATTDHPFWVERGNWQGWLPACSVRRGDILRKFGTYQFERVSGGIQFTFSNADHSDAMLAEVCGFTGIALGISMPVIAVYFNGQPVTGDIEVNRVSPYTGFRNKRNSKQFQNKADVTFDGSLRLRAAIARERTETPVTISGDGTEVNAACSALYDARRATAYLRTETREPPLLMRNKLLAASLTDTRASTIVSDSTAGRTTDRETISRTTRNKKRFTTDRTDFVDGMKCFLTDTRTPAPALSFLPRRDVNCSPTSLTGKIFTAAKAFRWTKLQFFIGDWHGILTRFYMGATNRYKYTTTVYNLQIEKDPTFYANGFLVHNCPICAPLDGQSVDADNLFASELIGAIDAPPGHINCRCWTEVTTEIE